MQFTAFRKYWSESPAFEFIAHITVTDTCADYPQGHVEAGPVFRGSIEVCRIVLFKIIVDESTNPPLVVNRNELRGKILLKPVKVAEIIVVEFTLLPSGATFSESLQ